MQGRTRRRNSYYVCEPRKNWGQEAARRFPGHPPTVYVPQDALLQGIFGFFGERIFGPRRRELLEADQRALDGEPERKREGRVQALRRAVEKLERRAARLIESLEREDGQRRGRDLPASGTPSRSSKGSDGRQSRSFALTSGRVARMSRQPPRGKGSTPDPGSSSPTTSFPEGSGSSLKPLASSSLPCSALASRSEPSPGDSAVCPKCLIGARL